MKKDVEDSSLSIQKLKIFIQQTFAFKQKQEKKIEILILILQTDNTVLKSKNYDINNNNTHHQQHQ